MNESNVQWLTSPEMTAKLAEFKKMRTGPYVLRKPDGKLVSDNLEKYGPFTYGSMEEAEAFARELELDYGWANGSVEVEQDLS